MWLTIFNGSPKGTGGNSELLIRWLKEGILQNLDINVDTLYLNKIGDHDCFINQFKISDIVLIVFPLYTDSMPGIVMAFFEKLQPLRKSLAGLKLGFVVHSGFPEAIHSRAVEEYLKWLVTELGADYFGTVIMGGSEGIARMSPAAIAKKKALFNELGKRLPLENEFNAELIKKVTGEEKFNEIGIFIVQILLKTGLLQHFWNLKLKKNNTYRDRFAKPYAN